jgi:hypothetical protein
VNCQKFPWITAEASTIRAGGKLLIRVARIAVPEFARLNPPPLNRVAIDKETINIFPCAN